MSVPLRLALLAIPLAIAAGASFWLGPMIPVAAVAAGLCGLALAVERLRAPLAAAALAGSVASSAALLVPTVGGIEATSFVFVGLAAVGIAARLARSTRGWREFTGAEWLTLLLVVAGLPAILLDAGGNEAVPGVLRMAQHAAMLAAIVSLAPTPRSVRIVAAGLLMGMLVQVGVGIVELGSGGTIFYSLWKPIEASTWNGIVRVASTPADPNYFALGLVGTLPLVVAARALWPRLPVVAVAALAGTWLLLIAFTFSRAGYIGALVLGVLAFALARRRVRWMPVLAVVAVLALGSLALADPLQAFAGRLATIGTGDASMDMRLAAQRAAFEAFLDHPLFGIGFDRFVEVGPTYLYRLTGVSVAEVNVLNSYLLAAVEGGVLAGLAFVASLAWTIRRLLSLAPLKDGAACVAPLGHSLALGLAAFSVISLTLDGIHSPVQWALLGLAGLVIRATAEPAMVRAAASVARAHRGLPATSHAG